jgi:hypothetical protein
MFYSRRRRVINDIRRRVEDGTAKDERQAIDQLEQVLGVRSLDGLCKNLRQYNGVEPVVAILSVAIAGPACDSLTVYGRCTRALVTYAVVSSRL